MKLEVLIEAGLLIFLHTFSLWSGRAKAVAATQQALDNIMVFNDQIFRQASASATCSPKRINTIFSSLTSPKQLIRSKSCDKRKHKQHQQKPRQIHNNFKNHSNCLFTSQVNGDELGPDVSHEDARQALRNAGKDFEIGVVPIEVSKKETKI